MTYLNPDAFEHPVERLMVLGAAEFTARVAPALRPQLGWPAAQVSAHLEVFALRAGLQYVQALNAARRGQWHVRVTLSGTGGHGAISLDYPLGQTVQRSSVSLGAVVTHCLFEPHDRAALSGDAFCLMQRARTLEPHGWPGALAADAYDEALTAGPFSGVLRRLATFHVTTPDVHRRSPHATVTQLYAQTHEHLAQQPGWTTLPLTLPGAARRVLH
ncbi:hypothetical protein [Deinococcus soli (ex Cha et al. 2016)]|uniref:Uncharacterized protein n=2 Tax=Deinococcus soli (ex Cha et al. 2016) TaxID=1309411 RepID=A0ACC6KL47_9DEIO|nr:hypothetical protein [Deinococcus soli (ex Cha et al. 2016)]MDR6218744.1 hypothetical protein [Deinococcus soli (ex Cha et al. 2016)]MDR6328541.1 hypothetical protein [Deinococcus soli (ex Cha et al. 2016)]MDR6753152.1 hypothetical protein [Deinococcus soli (ex Cha et al. 2016)]